MSELGRRALRLIQSKPLFPSFDRFWDKDISRQYIQFINNSPIALNQEETTHTRSLIQRFDAPKIAYFQFLRQLYPMSPHVHFESLYQSYLDLPTPQPVFIQHEHLEHLVQQLNKAAGENRHIVARYYEKIQGDMKRAGMPISEKEQNSLIALKFYNQKKAQPIDQAYEHLVNTSKGKLDISTINIFLKHAVRLQNVGFINKITQDLKDFELRPDRVTLATLFNYSSALKDKEGALGVFEAVMDSSVTMDIMMVNAVLNNLVSFGDLESATAIMNSLLDFDNQANNPMLSQGDNKSKRQYLKVSSFIDSLRLQTSERLVYPLTPTYDTFSPFLNHYVQLESFNPENMMKLLRFIKELDIKIPTSMPMKVLKVFKDHKMQNSKTMKQVVQLLQDQGVEHVKYHHNLVDNMIGASVTQSDQKFKTTNDLNEKWDKLEGVSKRRNWKHLDVRKLASDLVDEIAVSH